MADGMTANTLAG